MMKAKIFSIIAFFIVFNNTGQSLQDYLVIAEKNSPDIQANSYLYESALEKIVEVGSLPNATIGVGYFVQEAETRVGAQKAKISINQKIPWFGTLSAREEGASFKAKAVLNAIDLTKRSLFLEVKTHYYQLYELQAKLKILKENIDLIDTLEELALIELENNRSSMVDVLKIRMEKNELQDHLYSTQGILKSKLIGFNLLLNRDDKAPISIADHVSIEADPSILSRKLILNNPKLLKLDNLKKALNSSELVSKKEGAPSVGFGIDYILVEDRPVQGLIDNGKDIIMPMVSLSIPLFSKRYSSRQKQLNFEQKAISMTKIEVENELNSIFESAVSAFKNAANSVQTQSKNLNEADNAIEVLLAAYESSKIDFDQLLEVQQLKLKFQFKKVVSEKQYGIQKATLEFLTKETTINPTM